MRRGWPGVRLLFRGDRVNIRGIFMAELVVPVSDELEKQMKSSRIVNWERTARQAVTQRAAELSLFKKIVSKSRLTEKDALEIGGKINRGMQERLEKARR